MSHTDKIYHPPQPTEYKGVLFKSKCEAIFARCLDLAGFAAWEYEPAHWEHEGWRPDFHAVIQTEGHKIYACLIEYKPGPVTDAYLDTLTTRVESVIWDGHHALLAVANPYDPEVKRDVFEYYRDEWLPFQQPTFLQHLDEAAKYRYDLK